MRHSFLVRSAVGAVLVGCWVVLALAWLGPPVLGPLLGLALFTLLFTVMGVSFAPQHEVFGPAVTRAPARGAEVALTFDDGPHPEHSRSVMDQLEAAGGRGTFFVLGSRVDAHPEIVAEMLDRGHQVAHHGYAHRWWSVLVPRWFQEDLDAAERAVQQACGVRPRFFRPPLGVVVPIGIQALERRGLVLTAWSVRGFDGVSQDPDAVRDRVLTGVRGGDVVLLHDAPPPAQPDRAPVTVATLPGLLAGLAERGLRPVTLAALLDQDAYAEEGAAAGAARRSIVEMAVRWTLLALGLSMAAKLLML